MAFTDHLEVYQSFTGAELTAEKTRLLEARKGYLAQAAGGKSYQQDLGRIDDMLRAVVRVQNQNAQSSTGNSSRGTVDFSAMS